MVFVNRLKLNFLGLEGVPNARELGGYVLPDGGVIRHGLLLRGGTLGTATPADKQRMCVEYKVSHVFDFRTDMELKFMPDPEIAGAKYTKSFFLFFIEILHFRKINSRTHPAFLL